MQGKETKPLLEGITVIELAGVLAGPALGMFLAEAGARVIKVEPPAGDVTRTWKLSTENPDDDISAYFSAVNWGKKSIILNLTQKIDIQSLYDLVANAEIVISSFKPGDAQKLKADYETLSTINPELIYAHISGYGLHQSMTGYDAIIQAESGFMSMNGTPNSGPLKMPVALMDLLAAHQAKEAVLLAIIKKMKYGKGSMIDIPLYHSAVTSLANQATNWLVAGSNPKLMGSGHPNIAPYGNVYKAIDDRTVMYAIGNDRQFGDLCKILGAPELSREKRFITNPERVKNREALEKITAELTVQFEAEYLVDQLRRNQVPAAVVSDVREVFENHLSQDLILEGNDEGKTIKGLSTIGFYMKDAIKARLSPPPHLGQHTEEIFSRKNR